MTWQERKTNTLLKAGGVRKDGKVEPDRYGRGGWIGWTE